MIPSDATGTAFRRLALSAVVLFGLAGGAFGGPAKYDPATRSFSLSYTYATLPTYMMPPDQVEALGSLQQATPEQDAKFRGVQQAVSQILFQVTDGRARIGSLEYVDSIKKADIVVSLSGVADRGGYAQLGTIEGRPGQVILYYQNLVGEDAAGMTNTVAHELCHYLFALPDEYSNGTDCPLSNPGGPGCLMDNYFNRHGFLELCRPDTHNPQAPNQGTVIVPHKPSDSCRFWIDQFFNDHPPGPATPADPGATVAEAGIGEPVVTPDDPFTGVFKQLVDSATLFVRDELTNSAASMKAPATGVTARARALAEKFLKEQIPQAATALNFVKPTDAQRKQAVALIVKKATTGRVRPPANFTPKVVDQLRTKAKELAAGGKLPVGSLLQLLVTGKTDDDRLKKLQPTIAMVRKGLILYLTKGLLPGFAPSTSGSSGSTARLTLEEQRFVDQIAHEAVLGSAATSNLTVYQEAALLHIRLSLNTTETLNAIAGELNLPGVGRRNLSLREIEQKITATLKDVALPGRPFTGFGFRRTYVVAPRPQDPAYDFLDIDAGSHIPYEDIRNVAVGEMTRLLRRERVEFLDEDGPRVRANVNPGDLAGQLAGRQAAANPAQVAERFTNQVRLINQLIDAVRRNRVENIIIIVPPGGLSAELGDVLENLRKEVVDNPYSDVRIDLILWGLANVPLRTRDTVARTGGIVQAISDVDEFGAAAQRIENDLAAGSWITVPEQGLIDLTLATRNVERRGTVPAPPAMNLGKLRERFLGVPPRVADAPQDGADARRGREPEGGDVDGKPALDFRVFPATLSEIEHFNKRLGYVTDILVRNSGRPSTYDQVGNSVANLAMIQRNIMNMQDRLARLELGDPTRPFRSDLQELLALVERTKSLVRATLGVKDPALTPLNETDDYYQWIMRQMLVAEARSLDRELPGRGLSNRARSVKLNKISYFLQRATEFDQQLTDLRRVIYGRETDVFKAVKDKFEVILMTDSDKIPAKGKNQVIVASANGSLLFRVFGGDGQEIVSAGEASLLDQVPQIAELKGQLKDLWPPHELTREEKDRITTAVASITHSAPAQAVVALQAFDTLQEDEATFNWQLKADKIARRETMRSRSLGCLLLEAAKAREARIVAESNPDDRNPQDKPDARLQQPDPRSLVPELLELEKIALLLDLASIQPVNLFELDERIESLGNKVRSLQTRLDILARTVLNKPKDENPRGNLFTRMLPKDDAPQVPIEIQLKGAYDRSTRLKELTARLKQRAEDLKNLRANAGEEEPPTCEVDDRTLLLENALTPLRDSLNFPRELANLILGQGDRAQKPKILSPDDQRLWFGVTAQDFDDPAQGKAHKKDEDRVEAIADMLKLRVDELIYGDFPLLLLDTLGRVRMFESALKGLAESAQASDDTTPVFRRIKAKRPLAKATKSVDGKTVEIEFLPFRAEAGASIELVLGFSRPLQHFEALKKAPPTLRFYQSDKLIERTYLGFEADISTDTMLVWTVPKPDLNVGKIGAGDYSPRITFPIEYLPVTGRDNTLAYTFSVGTPRPNVQLLTALRQPQPTVANRDRSRDPEAAYRGTLAADQLEAVVEVQVIAGSSIKKAAVTGGFQRFDQTNEPIEFPRLKFLDDGVFPDLQKDDGIYTLSVTLMPNTRRKPGEYRLFITARSTDDTVFVPIAEPIPVHPRTDDKDENGVLDADKDKTDQLPKIPPFQRSSSMNFHISGES